MLCQLSYEAKSSCSSVWYFGTKSITFDTNVFYDMIFFLCFGVTYSGEYNVFDVTLSVYPHRAS